jgi:hypothetical protein
MRRQPGAVLFGIGLVVAGVWVIASALFPVITGQASVRLVGLQELWPVLVIVGGVAMLVQAIFRLERLNGLIFLGIITLLVGVVCLVFSLEVGNLAWRDMARWWPVFLIILAIGFMSVFVADDLRNRALLIPIYVTGGLGFLILPFTLGMTRTVAFAQTLQLWPMLVVLIVLLFLFRTTPADAPSDPDSSSQQ